MNILTFFIWSKICHHNKAVLNTSESVNVTASHSFSSTVAQWFALPPTAAHGFDSRQRPSLSVWSLHCSQLACIGFVQMLQEASMLCFCLRLSEKARSILMSVLTFLIFKASLISAVLDKGAVGLISISSHPAVRNQLVEPWSTF